MHQVWYLVLNLRIEIRIVSQCELADEIAEYLSQPITLTTSTSHPYINRQIQVSLTVSTVPVGVLCKCMGAPIVRCVSVGGMEGGREKFSVRSDAPVRVAKAVLDSRRAGCLAVCLRGAWLGSRKSCFAAGHLELSSQIG